MGPHRCSCGGAHDRRLAITTTKYFQNALGVFQGGGCRGAAYVGAYEEALDRGVNFAEVAGTSAGSIIASLIGAGADAKFLTSKIEELDYSEFNKPLHERPKSGLTFRFAKTLALFLGRESRLAIRAFADGALYSSEYIEQFVEDALYKLLGKRDATFEDLVIPTYVVATDLKGRTVKVWSKDSTPSDRVAQAVRASCSIPFFFPVVQNRFVDGGILSNLPTFVFANGRQPSTTRVLAFNLTSDELQGDVEVCRQGLIRSLVDTVIDGSGDLQAKLFSVARIEINTGQLRATDFDKINKDANNDLAGKGRRAVSEFFENEKLNINTDKNSGLLAGDDEMRAVITQKLNEHVDQIDICEKDTDFIFKMFPSFLEWRSSGIPITAQYPSQDPVNSAERYRRALLKAMGVDLLPLDRDPTVRGYFFNCNRQEGASCVAGPLRKSSVKLESATQYEGISHYPVISAIYKAAGFRTKERVQPTFKVVPGRESDLIDRLKTVDQYKHADVEIEKIKIEDVKSLTEFVHEFKYRQIPTLVRKFEGSGVDLFGCAAVEFDNGSYSFITPPVVEELGGKFVLIEGTTRLTWLKKNGYLEATVVVVRGVVDQLPAKIVDLTRIWVGHNSLREKRRYGDSFDYSRFRKIEERVHLLQDVQEWNE